MTIRFSNWVRLGRGGRAWLCGWGLLLAAVGVGAEDLSAKDQTQRRAQGLESLQAIVGE